MRKINFGAGNAWQEDGWEVLDNGTGSYKESWKHRGKAWDSRLPDNTYDILFTSHMLEHIPHFRLEKTIAEFNRIMKVGGRLRILVPSLKKYATAYVNGNEDFFRNSSHYSDHLGIGGSFVRVLISPGGQTIAMSRELDEIFGGYAHLYSYDFDMLRILLNKWGFDQVVESERGESAISELRTFQYLAHDGATYDLNDPFVRNREYLKTGKPWRYGGFDKTSTKQLAVETLKVRDEPYALDKEFAYNRRNRGGDQLDQFKLKLFRGISILVDAGYGVAKKSGLIKLLWALR